ncbi:retrovirus-related pol polyprotein from transposon TNT 1-94, partial [Tanacetum coccineum]
KTFLPQTNNQLRTSSNPRNQATVQDGRVLTQNVQGRHNRGQGNNARGAGAVGYGRAQNRVGNANPGQARQVKCYNCNGVGHIARNCTQPKRPHNSEYFKDKMLLMQAQENRVALDEEQLLFISDGQDNAIDEDVDEKPVQDLALNVDNVFQADDYPVYDEAGPSYDSDILSEVNHDHYHDAVVDLYDEHELHDDYRLYKVNASMVPNVAYGMIDNDLHESDVPSVSHTPRNTVVNNLFILNCQYKETSGQLSYYDEVNKVAIGYKNPLCLHRARQDQPALYTGHVIVAPNHAPAIVNITPPNYLKENFLATFTPQKQLTPEQLFWSQDIVKMKAEALKEQNTRPIKALTVYPPNTPATLGKKNSVKKRYPTPTGFTEGVRSSNKEVKEIREWPLDELEAETRPKSVLCCSKSETLMYYRVTGDAKGSMLSKPVVWNLIELSNLRDDVRVNSCTDASGSQPRSILKKHRIPPAKSDSLKKVEDHLLNDVFISLGWAFKCSSASGIFGFAAHVVVQIVLWYLDSGCSKHMTGDRSRLMNFVKKFIGTVRFGNDHFGAIMGYGDYVIGDSVISRVYYVEGLGHNLFSVGQFCDSDLEVAFRKHSCYVRDTDGVELLKGSRGSNLYTISVEDMMKSSPICLLSKASKNKSWLWHRRLNHLNFGTINDLARKDLARGLPRLKFEKDHLCSACQLGKSKKHTHKPKTENTNLEVLNTLHMDLCGPMRVQTINGKKYILVIVDDYSRFTWVKFLRSKDETPAVVIKFLTQIQVGLNKTVRFIRTDNGTEFVNKTLYDHYEKVGIFHQKTVPRTPQQNGVVERRNRTLVEAARTMLIFSKAPMFLWAEAVATACYTQNRSLIHTRHEKTPYELVHDKKPDLTFFRVFGALCYPTNDSENLGKLQPTADIGIFVGYAPFRSLLSNPEPFVNVFALDYNSEASSSGEININLNLDQSTHNMNINPEMD